MDMLHTQSARASRAWSQRTSVVSSEPSVIDCITPSQPSSPVASPESKPSYARVTSIRISLSHIDKSSLLSFIASETKSPSEHQFSPITPTAPAPFSYESDPESANMEDQAPVTPTASSFLFEARNPAPAHRGSSEGGLTVRNSLEREIVLDPKDQDALVTAIKLLSGSQGPSTPAQNHCPACCTSTVKNLRLPEPAARALYALFTNAFTPSQLRAAGQIQRFLNNHPADPIPRHFISEEIAEINRDHGWCLIGKCGLARISYKITCSTSTTGISMDAGLEEDLSGKPIHALTAHIRDSHFKQTPFPCLLCPASFNEEIQLGRHLRTHPLGDFECPACGDVLYYNELRQRHQHSHHTKERIGDKLLRLINRVVPLK